jgi:tetratricopeptide (TPR) repeat protein
MPKPIKKKLARPAPVDEDFDSVISKIGDAVEKRQRQLVAAAVAFLLVVAVSVGLYVYKASVRSEAQRLEYEGYKHYFGLYEQTPAPEAERLNRALESFQKAYEKRESPYSLLYVANCYFALGKYDDAVSTLWELNRKFPDDERFVPLAYYKMAMVQMKAGKNEDALKSLEVLYGYRTESYRDLALVEAARLLEDMGRTEEASEKYGLITRNYPGSFFFDEASAKSGKETEEEKGKEAVKDR